MRRLTLVLLIISCQGFLYAQQNDLVIIKANITAFSNALMTGDTLAINNAYTSDGKILPNGTPILEGNSLKEYWNEGVRNGQTYYHHKVTPEEIKILGDHAYDYGYYEGESGSEGNRSKWKGKYVIIWRKLKGDWKIYLDIWNRVPLVK
jgi:ketosteroid isomerase-like protein